MKLNKMSQEELELYSYVDLTKMILEEGKTLNTPQLFKKICDLLKLSDEDYENKIGDYYTSLTTDKDFVLLNDGKWDLRDRHSVEIVLDDALEADEEIEEPFEEETEEDGESIDSDVEVDDLDEEDETEDLTILTEEELEEE